MTHQTNKLVLAVLQEEDYEKTVSALNQHGFFVTKLSTSGGFLKKKNTTILVGVEEDRYVELIDLIKGRAGKRQRIVYSTPPVVSGVQMDTSMTAVPLQIETSGVTVFTLSLDRLDKF